MMTQIEEIKKKAKWISIKLWPVLKSVSLDYRKNLWMILIRPLFEQITLLFASETSKTNKKNVIVALRQTFKNFTLIKKNMNNSIIDDLMQFNIEDRAKINMISTKIKWQKRLGKQIYPDVDPAILEQLEEKEKKRKRRVLPIELQKLINLCVAKCPICRKRCNQEHMKRIHNISIPNYDELIDMIEKRSEEAKRFKYSRKQTLKHVGDFINIYINSMKNFLSIQST
jgi:hypothetical protein